MVLPPAVVLRILCFYKMVCLRGAYPAVDTCWFRDSIRGRAFSAGARSCAVPVRHDSSGFRVAASRAVKNIQGVQNAELLARGEQTRILNRRFRRGVTKKEGKNLPMERDCDEEHAVQFRLYTHKFSSARLYA